MKVTFINNTLNNQDQHKFDREFGRNGKKNEPLITFPRWAKEKKREREEEERKNHEMQNTEKRH